MLGQLNYFTRKKLRNQGVSAPATVLEIADSGMSVTHGSEGVVGNTELILKTRLRVEPLNEPAFEVQQRFRYAQLSIPPVGSKLTVLYDPEDHDKLMIDRDAAPASVTLNSVTQNGAPIDLGGLLATVQQAKAAGGGDREKIAEALRASLGGQNVTVIDGTQMAGLGGGAESPEEERIRNLERLVALRDAGALTPDEFATRKAALLAE
ncbi:MAG: SHOCT domain-containing protein [Solirubrobacteraceae bacterium]